MTFIICEDKAPPVVFDILRGLNIDGEAEAFIDRCVIFARNHEDDFLQKVDDNQNSRLSSLMIILMAKSHSEETRAKLINSGYFEKEFPEVNAKLHGWDELCVALTFASDTLLNRMISRIPKEVLVTVISQIPEPTRTNVRKKFLM
ncbi:hypothetical protein KC723_02375 [Candidatus Kaiserbacteria bacterium]|nr:hypothetical protein [Candidatus Kaiserbacteria bacterium]